MNKSFRHLVTALAVATLWPAILLAQDPDTLLVAHKVVTDQVAVDADDPALWIHPTMPESSIVLGTDKGMTFGGLYVWNMNGSLRQTIPLSHPNNVDVKSGLRVGTSTMDIAVVSNRDQDEIRVYKIDPDTRMLSDVTAEQGIAVFDEPYGLTLYRRAEDDSIFAILSSKGLQYEHELWQIRLTADSTGQVTGERVRIFGDHQGIAEGMVVDDELGYLYYAEGEAGIRKYHADPRKSSGRLAFFATESDSPWDRKGLALYKCSNGTGYLLLASPDDRSIKVYPRAGDGGDVHHHPLLAVIQNTAGKRGVGLEVTNMPTSRRFPLGVLVWHDEGSRRFRLYAWEEVAQNVLAVCPPVITQVETGSQDARAVLPALQLHQNYPNPFNPSTAIRFELAQAGVVRLSIYNVLGKNIRTLKHEMMAPGRHTLLWDGKDDQHEVVPSGVYFCKAELGGFVQMRKITLLR